MLCMGCALFRILTTLLHTITRTCYSIMEVQTVYLRACYCPVSFLASWKEGIEGGWRGGGRRRGLGRERGEREGEWRNGRKGGEKVGMGEKKVRKEGKRGGGGSRAVNAWVLHPICF